MFCTHTMRIMPDDGKQVRCSRIFYTQYYNNNNNNNDTCKLYSLLSNLVQLSIRPCPLYRVPINIYRLNVLIVFLSLYNCILSIGVETFTESRGGRGFESGLDKLIWVTSSDSNLVRILVLRWRAVPEMSWSYCLTYYCLFITNSRLMIQRLNIIYIYIIYNIDALFIRATISTKW